MKRKFLRWWWGWRYHYCFEHAKFKIYYAGGLHCPACTLSRRERQERESIVFAAKRDARLERLR